VFVKPETASAMGASIKAQDNIEIIPPGVYPKPINSLLTGLDII
jgi:hypothetical protein